MGVVVEKLDQHSDHRGTVFEPLSGDDIARQRNAHVVLTGPDHVRGNHYHTRGDEVMAVRGPALVRFREDGEIRDIHVPDGDVFAFRFPAGVPHAIRNTGTSEGLLVAFREVEHDPAAEDTVREVLLEP